MTQLNLINQFIYGIALISKIKWKNKATWILFDYDVFSHLENIDCDMFLIFVDNLYFKNDIKMLFHFSYCNKNI